VAASLMEIERRKVTGVISVPAPFAPLSAFLRALPRPMSVLWDAPGDQPMAAAGVVDSVMLSGASRYEQLQKWTDALWRRIAVFTHPDCVPMAPRVFGGVAFHHGVRGASWAEFGDGCFALPRWYYVRRADTAVIGLAAQGAVDRGASRHAELMTQLDELIEALEAYEGQATSLVTIRVARVPRASIKQIPFEEWDSHIGKIHRVIDEGRFYKIVAARRCEVTMPRPVDDILVVTGLAAEPNCTRFAFRRAESSFIGASPEVLFSKVGNKLTTQALAGTLRSMSSDLPALSQRSSELLDSKKDNTEHELVVRDIQDALEPFCEAVASSRTPDVRKVRNILHLNTPFFADLRNDIEPIDLLAALHPTPAVGGMPKRDAAEWITANEREDRGWYTGAVGWLDANRDARFVVAIRCGLITERIAYVYSGAGIIRSSDAAAEYSETELKQGPLLRALGVVE
jgi:isochorismate synthase